MPIAILALLVFLLLAATAVAISRQEPRKTGQPFKAWRLLFVAGLAVSLVLAIVALTQMD
jgi:hypothetical protein